MNLELEYIDSVEVRLATQIVAFSVTLIVTYIVFNHYKRNKDYFPKYLAISFSLFLIQALFMLFVFVYSLATEQKLPELIMPVIDHLLKITAISFYVFSFAFTFAKEEIKIRKFNSINIIIILTAIAPMWYYWHNYLISAPLAEQRFAYFWIDPIFEIWNLALLLFGMYCITFSRIKMKKAFFVSLIILMSKESIHIYNIFISNNTIPWIAIVKKKLIHPPEKK